MQNPGGTTEHINGVSPPVTNQLTTPLPWWDLRGRGSSLIRFGLARRWLRALSPVYLHCIATHCTSTSYPLVLTCLGLRSGPISLIVVIMICCVFHSVRSHGALYPMTDLPTYGLMTLSADAPRCSIMFHSTWLWYLDRGTYAIGYSLLLQADVAFVLMYK